jgi:hypothetical protein
MRRSVQTLMWMTLVLGLVASPIRAATPARVALVIGNSTYIAAGKLANPAADARLVADSLHRAGFTDVTLQLDLTKQDFEKALRTFQKKADGAEVALVYYAGHGLEVDGRNWLVPVDATLADQRDLPFQGIDLDVVLGTVAAAKGLRMVVLDACRDNPFTRSMRRLSGTRGIAERGLADIEVTGTLVFYAQRAGQTALDGTNGAADSPFATAFAARIPEKGVDIRILISEVRDDVLASTDNKQEPFSYGSLPGIALELVPGTTGSGATRSDPELQAFNEAVSRNSVEGWDAFLKAHPAGRYATLARSQRDVIRARAAPPASPPPQGYVATHSAAPGAPVRPVVRDENASQQAEVDGDAKMYAAISMAACLTTNCFNSSAEERQRQTAQAARDCVTAKKQWRSALERTTSPQRATALRPKIDGDAIQCRKGDTCVNTAATGYWYEYFSPTINDYVRAGNFHCSESDAVVASGERPPPQSAARDDNASRQDEYDGDAKMYEAISIAACVSKNCLSYSTEERRQQSALARRDCITGKKLWRSALNKAASPDRAIALATKINGDALQCDGGGCVKTAASGYWYEYYLPAIGRFEKAPDFHCSESDPL